METTIKLTENQKRALELVKELADQGHITAPQAFILIMGIYENEKETVYIPYQNPYSEPQPWTVEPYTTKPNSVPWWDNQILCGQANTAQADPNKPGAQIYCYAISGTPKSPWNIDFTGWRG